MTGLAVRPMTAAEFTAWTEELAREYAADKVAAGAWPPEGAVDRARRDTAGLLPRGADTPGMLLLTAEAGGRPVGRLWISLRHPDGVRDCAWLYDIEVAAGERGAGFGRQLLAAAEDAVRRAGVGSLQLNVFGRNAAARRLYERAGYEVVSQQMRRRLTRQVLFVQGGGAGTHDEWDAALVASLRRELGDAYEVRYPRMPDEDDPGTWAPAVRRELDALEDGAAVVAHSAGAAVLAAVLRERPPARLSAVVLVAAPFTGAGGWEGPDLGDLGAHLPDGVEVHVLHGTADDTVPPEHAALYGRAVPQARVHLLPGRDHQLGDDLREVAALIRAAGGPGPAR